MDLGVIILTCYFLLIAMFFTNTGTYYSKIRIGMIAGLCLFISIAKLLEVL